MHPADTPISTVREIWGHFHDPAHMVEIQAPSDRTRYAWQNMSGFAYTMQVLRDGPISELPEHPEASIGDIAFTRSTGNRETVDSHFDSSTMDALIVVQAGTIVYERYKTMRPFDKHNWFSSGKTISGTLVALLEHEGKVDVTKPVSTYVPQLAGSDWDVVTVEETLDMATGLDSTEHDEVVDDSRTNPERGWYKWAVAMGIFEDKEHLGLTPIDVLRSMKRIKPGHTAFEYNSMNTSVLELVVNEVTQRTVAEELSERVWRRIGAQNDAYIGADKYGDTMSWGWMNSTLRDMARWAMIFTPSGDKVAGTEVIPSAVLDTIHSGGRPEMYDKGRIGNEVLEMFPDETGIYNRYQWDAVFTDGDMLKMGVGGQGTYISPTRDVVVCYFSTGKNEEPILARAIVRAR